MITHIQTNNSRADKQNNIICINIILLLLLCLLIYIMSEYVAPILSSPNLNNAATSVAIVNVIGNNYTTDIANAHNNLIINALSAVQTSGATGGNVFEINNTIICENYGNPTGNTAARSYINNQDIYLGWTETLPPNELSYGPTGYIGNINLATINGLPIQTIGATGAQGADGVTGPQGVTGVQGVTGAQGVTGVTGAQGVTGVQGVTGAQGADGVTGPQGVTGIDGATGPQGATGVAGGALGYYGSFGNTGGITATAINTAYALEIGYVDGTGNNGINLVGSAPYTSLQIDYPGVYNVQFSGQINRVSAGGNDLINIWIEQDSGSGFQQIPASNTALYVPNNEPQVAAWNWFIKTTTTNEKIRLMWETDNIDIVWSVAPGLTGTPAIPSLILTVQQVMNTQNGATGATGANGLFANIATGQTTDYDVSSSTTLVGFTGDLGGYLTLVANTTGTIVLQSTFVQTVSCSGVTGFSEMGNSTTMYAFIDGNTGFDGTISSPAIIKQYPLTMSGLLNGTYPTTFTAAAKYQVTSGNTYNFYVAGGYSNIGGNVDGITASSQLFYTYY